MSIQLPTPINYWNFNEQSIDSAADSLGGLHALIETSQGKWSVPGKWKNAIRLGTSDGALIVKLRRSDGTAAPDLDPPWSLAVWVRRDKNGRSGGATLLSSKSSAIKIEQWEAKSKRGITLCSSMDPTIHKVLPLGEWAHLTLVGSATDTRLYVNGAFVESIPVSIKLPRDHLGSTDGYIEFLEATLEELRFYDQALTPEQVRELAGVTPTNDVNPPPELRPAFEKLQPQAALDAQKANVAQLAARGTSTTT